MQNFVPTFRAILFVDGCPSDQLTDDTPDRWHTFAFVVLQLDPGFQWQPTVQIDSHSILRSDKEICKLEKMFPKMKKWSASRHNSSWRRKFVDALHAVQSQNNLMFINAVSFQEKTLRAVESAVLEKYNDFASKVGIGFNEIVDSQGRLVWEHKYVNFSGAHSIRGLKNQMLVLVFLASCILNQYHFYRKTVLTRDDLGFEDYHLTIVSDRLSGDGHVETARLNLGFLINPGAEFHEHGALNTTLTRSPFSDEYFLDLLADNIAGLFNEIIEKPTGTRAQDFLTGKHRVPITGWHFLEKNVQKQTLTEVIPYLMQCRKK